VGRLTDTKTFANDELDPSIERIFVQLKAAGFIIENVAGSPFLISPTKVSTDREKVAKSILEDFEGDAFMLQLARSHFISFGKATRFTIYRNPSPYSLTNKFDAIGEGGWKKKVTLVLECNLRRVVTREDIQGLKYRIWSTVRRKAFSVPLISYYIGNQFTPEALQLARENSIRCIYSKQILQGGRFAEDQPVPRRRKEWEVHYGQLKGRVFEDVVEKALKALDYGTERDVIYNEKARRIYRKPHKRDSGKNYDEVDVIAKKTDTSLMVECKSAHSRLPWKQLKERVHKWNVLKGVWIGEGYNAIAGLIIAHCDDLSKVEARSYSSIPLTFQTPQEFYFAHQKELRGEYRWLFGIVQKDKGELRQT
jgi:hypothetical protein